MNNNQLTQIWKQFAIFPCAPKEKFPATKHGFKDAEFDQDIMMFINRGYNVGVACKKSEIVIIDLDHHEHNATPEKDINKLEIKLGAKLPKTLTQTTPGGNGKHLIFSSKGIVNPIGKIGKYIDIKWNGYCIIAPSVYKGKQYKITDGIDKYGNAIIAELPPAWLDYINKDTGIVKISEKIDYSKCPKRTYKDINPEKLFTKCAFLSHCRDNADELSYNEWFSMITVLAQIENSDDLIHKLSEPYPKYNYSETQRMIENARKFGKPHSCKHISSSFQNLCKGCISARQEKEIKS